MREAGVRISTGVGGLDEILEGGLIAGKTYVVRGGPGTGKTTLGMQFLAEGARLGEKTLFISLDEAEESIRQSARTLGLRFDDVAFLDMSPPSDYFTEVQTYDIFSPAEVEREPFANRVTEAVLKHNPTRVFLDPLTQFRYLSTDIFQFRKQVLSFLRFLTEQGATVVFTSESSTAHPDEDLQFMADGILDLLFDEEGGRSVCVKKLRGSDFMGNTHSMRLSVHGMEVYPRLVPKAHNVVFSLDTIPSGVAELDDLISGGVERGTVTFLSGPTGVGKTTVGLQFMKEAAERGERSVLFSFEEEVSLMLYRAQSIGMDARELVDQGMLRIERIEPLRYSPDEFAKKVRSQVEEDNVRVVMIDSVSGYRLCMRGSELVAHLHALCKYLQNMGVAVLLAIETTQLTGDFRVTDVDISYLSDNIIFLRYLEIDGHLRKAIGVLKKRLSNFEKTLREFEITPQGIRIGEPLLELRGILSGVPAWNKRGEA
ncbi:AAA family ATPase [Geomonas sp. RF6]|uniref:ATPase domain-containing protein n=1 Tax=Geomonas sp. RF6 TaxID=2897342 RepID=UPI001E3C91EE|nr:ATPase domain-containing protein [Geomonas sp. RF6]UFS71391.1 AAA family ATPase [Geomonas sp. RF6]